MVPLFTNESLQIGEIVYYISRIAIQISIIIYIQMLYIVSFMMLHLHNVVNIKKKLHNPIAC